MSKKIQWLIIGGMSLLLILRLSRHLLPTSAMAEKPRTVDDVVKRYGPAAEERLKPHFEKTGVAYPPQAVTLIGLKDEKKLEVWARGVNENWRYIYTYPMLAASGAAGPKLRQGDEQVPEGIYNIAYLNPNSRFHLSMKINYPNAFDKARGKDDARKYLGGEIFIHGKDVSIGCIALGDPAIEELFTLAQRTGIKNIGVIIAPNDLRQREPVTDLMAVPAWTKELYAQIKKELAPFK